MTPKCIQWIILTSLYVALWEILLVLKGLLKRNNDGTLKVEIFLVPEGMTVVFRAFPGPEIMKLFFMLNSIKHEILTALKSKMVGKKVFFLLSNSLRYLS